jgi:hypothetical protein
MSGNSAWLADHVASLLPRAVVSFLPKATAGACVPPYSWVSQRTTCNQIGGCCDSVHSCHYNCQGVPVCTPWRKTYCY